MKKKLLWVGDAACPSGFARATHETLDVLRKEFDVVVLGMSYRGDPPRADDVFTKYYVNGNWPYPIYAAMAGGDPFGVGRLIWMCDLFKPDVIVLQNDGWNIPFYVQTLAKYPEYDSVPIVAAVAIDGNNFDGRWLDGISYAIFWTQFAFNEARIGGYAGPASVIPLGVDTDVYKPMDKPTLRREIGSTSMTEHAFIVGNVNRNQPRKRWDLMIRYFAEWIHAAKIDDAYLYFHVAPTGDEGVDVKELVRYYGIKDRVAHNELPPFYGVPESEMCRTYNFFDVYASTTQGEGMGLPAMEAMACGIPCILPGWSAYGDWASGAAHLVPCTSTAIGPPYKNVIGGVVDEGLFIAALQAFYEGKTLRADTGSLGLARVSESRFGWPEIGRRWLEVLSQILGLEAAQTEPGLPESSELKLVASKPLTGPTEAEWADLGRPEEVLE